MRKEMFRDRDTIAALANLAQNTTDEITREAIAYTLGFIGKGDRDATNALIYLTYNSSDELTLKKYPFFPVKSFHRCDRASNSVTAPILI